jgi:hypothetical protein
MIAPKQSAIDISTSSTSVNAELPPMRSSISRSSQDIISEIAAEKNTSLKAKAKQRRLFL